MRQRYLATSHRVLRVRAVLRLPPIPLLAGAPWSRQTLQRDSSSHRDSFSHELGDDGKFSVFLTTVEAIRPSRERGLEPAYICPYKNVQSTLVQIGKTLVQTFCFGTKFCSGLLTTEVLGWAR